MVNFDLIVYASLSLRKKKSYRVGKQVPVGIQQIYFRNSYSQNLQNKQTKFMSVTGFFPPNFLVRKSSANGEFLQIFGRFVQKYVEVARSRKISLPGNLVFYVMFV